LKAAFFLFFHCALFLAACSQQDTTEPVPLITKYILPVDGSGIVIQKTSYRTNQPSLFVHLHSNETTAAEVAQAFAAREGITLLRILNGNERLIPFQQGNKQFRFDPNRIFSDVGIRNTLDLYNNGTDAAFSAVKAFRDSLLALMDTGKIIIALHNNTNESFSILHYKESNLPVHINSDLDPDDFFLTNDEMLFNQLRELNFNVVLEDATQVEDDGSLSIYCSRQNIRYVNVEAEHGHLQEQTIMLTALLQLLK
jgi:hypothetical protein